MALAVVLVQAGCTQTNEPAKVGEVQQQTKPNPGGSSSISSPVRAEKPAVRSVVLPEGTDLAVRITTAMSTNTHETGQPFTGHLDQPLMLDGDPAIIPSETVLQFSLRYPATIRDSR